MFLLFEEKGRNSQSLIKSYFSILSSSQKVKEKKKLRFYRNATVLQCLYNDSLRIQRPLPQKNFFPGDSSWYHCPICVLLKDVRDFLFLVLVKHAWLTSFHSMVTHLNCFRVHSCRISLSVDLEIGYSDHNESFLPIYWIRMMTIPFNNKDRKGDYSISS